MTTDTLAETAPRVALLARQGAACERLQAALQEAGADIVLVSDPAETDVASVRNAGAKTILIALEPAVEDALDRFDALLADPAITVIFDEAELAAKRDGWDAARWTRHLAAKLNRHQQVLPPGAEVDAALAATPPPPERYQRPESDGDISAFVGEADLRELEVPRDFDPNARLEVVATFDPDAQLEAASTFDPNVGMDPAAAFDPNVRLEGASMFDPVLAEMDTFAAPEASPDMSGLAELLLEPVVEAPGDNADTHHRFRRDLDDLHLRIADMTLEDSRLPRSAPLGAVVVLAGIGGPDAVRQLLGDLPANFPRPVLIQQRLEGGRHDKLVRQMQRATTMPVTLAEPGLAITPGNVYMLPADIGVTKAADGLQFEPAAGASVGEALFAALPAAESAVVLLSGSDPAAVDAAMNHAIHGALVAGQSTDGCFDAVAASALVARGADVGTPAQIARKLAARWPSTDAASATH
jgi:chemosensory pili system protein ChpB (putative protein-glutamate methylesterase)